MALMKGWLANTEQLVELVLAGETEYPSAATTNPTWHWPGIESRRPWWEAGNWLPKLWMAWPVHMGDIRNEYEFKTENQKWIANVENQRVNRRVTFQMDLIKDRVGGCRLGSSSSEQAIAARVWSWPLISIVSRLIMVELYLHSPHTSSWHGA
jgi:hypothetical protein